MRKMVALFAALLFATSMIVAGGCAKKEEASKPAAETVKPPEAEKKVEEVKPGEAAKASEVAKPAEAPPPPGEKAKAEKPMRAYGRVVNYEVGKTIKVKGSKEREWMFDIAPDAKIKGEVKEGVKVRVVYKKEGEKMIAHSIMTASARKAKSGKK